MSLFTKTGPWVVASIMTVATVFGQNSKCSPPAPQCCPAPKVCCEEVKPIQLMPAYNAPSRIEVRGCWDVYASASFTYWQAIQENMELGVVYDATASGVTGNVINPNFNYKPGFKVGLGMNFDHDNWDSFVEYTWFRGSHSTSTSLVIGGPDAVLPLWTAPLEDAYYEATQNWRLHMDILDWELARSYYVGTKLTFRPFFAARAAWIRQNVDVDYSHALVGDTSYNVDKRSHSWAVGPRAGLYTNWMIGEGFRLYGNGSGDILFTQYTKLKSADGLVSAAGVESLRLKVIQHKLNQLRTHLDLELGLGWGTYFDCNNWHVDLTAGYGFQVFFDQNMFRHFTDDVGISISNTPNGNLYMHGLTATVRFDF